MLLVLYVIVLPLDAVIVSNVLQFRRSAGIVVFLLLSLVWEVTIAVAIFDLATEYQIGIGYCRINAEKLVSECTYPGVFNSSCRQLDEVEGKSEKFRNNVETGCKEALSQKNSACVYDEQDKVIAFSAEGLDESSILRGFKNSCAPTILDPLWKQLYGETRAEALIPNSNPAKTQEELREHLENYRNPEVGTWK